jgi:simple sugar transport system permease protein
MTDTQTATAGQHRWFGGRIKASSLQELVLVPVIILACVIGAILHDAFLTQANIINILQQSSELAVIVIAESLILIAGKFDLSLESIVGVAPVFAAWLATDTLIGGSGLQVNGYVAVVVLFGVGILVGTFNGFLISRVKLNAFMTTLAMLILLRGITVGLTNGRTLFDLPEQLTYLGGALWLGIPASVWIAGFLFLAVGLFLRYHSFGRAIYAVGGNPEAARAAGIRVERLIWIVFIVGGAMSALAGLLLTGRLDSALSGQGEGMIFSVFAAAVIGGVSMSGGRGTMFGALTGVLLLGIISNILVLAQVPSFWINAVYGAIILAALVLAKVTSRGKASPD